MKYSFFLFFAIIANQLTAQASNVIEISVDETIERTTETIKLQLFLQTEEEQKKQQFGEEYEYGIYEDDELEKEQEQLIANFKAKTLEDMKAILDNNNFKYSIVRNADASEQEIYGLYDDADEYYSEALELERLDQKEWVRLNELIKGEEAMKQKVVEINFSSTENLLNDLVPKLTQKAKRQAQLLAASLDRKLGKVIRCSNVYPSIISPPSMSTLTSEFEEILRENYSGYQAFARTKKEVVQYIYTFELL